jgi:acetylornithine deacetylase
VRVTWTGGSFASGQLPPGHPLLPGRPGAVATPAAAPGGARDRRRQRPAAVRRGRVPTLHYGPGDLRLAHGPREKVPVAEVVTAARAFALLTLRTAGVR